LTIFNTLFTSMWVSLLLVYCKKLKKYVGVESVPLPVANNGQTWCESHGKCWCAVPTFSQTDV